MVLHIMRDVWRSVCLAAGELCVMMHGIATMQEWYVGNWDTQLKVSKHTKMKGLQEFDDIMSINFDLS